MPFVSEPFPALLLALSLAVIACGSAADRESLATPTPTPPPSATPYPVFEGTLNGITFGPHSREPSPAQMSPKCVLSNSGIGNVKTDVVRDDESFVVASVLDFEFTYLPAGARFSYVAASRCEDDVIAIQREYSLPDGHTFYVVRKKGPAYYVPNVPLAFSRLTATSIGGRPAVVQEAWPYALYMVDASSSWEVSGLSPQGDLVKVAEGLRSRYPGRSTPRQSVRPSISIRRPKGVAPGALKCAPATSPLSSFAMRATARRDRADSAASTSKTGDQSGSESCAGS